MSEQKEEEVELPKTEKTNKVDKVNAFIGPLSQVIHGLFDNATGFMLNAVKLTGNGFNSKDIAMSSNLPLEDQITFHKACILELEKYIEIEKQKVLQVKT
jgi:hypothetical protein